MSGLGTCVKELLDVDCVLFFCALCSAGLCIHFMFYPCCFAYDRCVIYIEICCCVATNFFLVLHDHFDYLWLFVLLYEFALVHSSLLRFLLGTFSDLC